MSRVALDTRGKGLNPNLRERRLTDPAGFVHK